MNIEEFKALTLEEQIALIPDKDKVVDNDEDFLGLNDYDIYPLEDFYINVRYDTRNKLIKDIQALKAYLLSKSNLLI